MPQVKFRFPGNGDRTLVCGRTNSGKTLMGLHLLAHQDFETMTWIIIDFKGRDTAASMPVTQEIKLNWGIPPQPGLFYVKAPMDDGQSISPLLLDAIERGNVGIYMDETRPVGMDNRGFRTCLFAGRSANVAMIYCSQTPYNIEPLARSQATFFSIFDLTDSDDRKAVRRYVRTERLDIERQLPKHYSYWFDVEEQGGCIVPPAPSEAQTALTILHRLPEPEDPQVTGVEEDRRPPARPRRRL